MTKQFIYNTNGNGVQNVPAPIWSDFDPRSEMSQKMIETKQINDKNYWRNMRKVFEHDYNTLPKNRFKVWASTMSVPLVVRHKTFEYVSIALEAAKRDHRYRAALEESMIGYGSNDDFQIFSMFDDFRTTMLRILHVAHLVVCGYTPERLSKLETITEFGAGIGEMAEIIYKLGFRGKYTIYDFPEISNIQKYLHQQLGLKNITYTDDYTQLTNSDLCIGTWSFTEMPFDLREKIMYNVGGSKEWLLAYSRKIFGFDNQKYIEETFIPALKNHHTNIIDMPCMPWDGGACYLVATQRNA